MAFRITKQKDIYEVQGILNSQNQEAFKNYFNLVLKKAPFIKMSLSKVKNLDNTGIRFITAMYKKAQDNNKPFFIVGVKNRKLIELFKQQSITTY